MSNAKNLIYVPDPRYSPDTISMLLILIIPYIRDLCSVSTCISESIEDSGVDLLKIMRDLSLDPLTSSPIFTLNRET